MTGAARRFPTWLVGLAILGVVVWFTGPGPFVAGVRALDASTLALGVGLAVPITCACAWRWHLVAQGLGVPVPPTTALASCYRAQFLNTVLPGGVLGDVHRGVHHGRSAGHTGLGVRAVVWERAAGQLVLALVTLAALVLAPSPWRGSAAWLLGALLLGALVVGMALRLPRSRRPRASRWAHVLRDDVRHGLLARAAWPGVVVASLLAVAGHVTTYLVAARAVGVTAATVTLLPIALVVLVAAGLPTNVAGWGPREGAAAWTSGVAGLGVDQGVATAVAYGAMVAVANLPGAVVLVLGGTQRHAVARLTATRGSGGSGPWLSVPTRSSAAGSPSTGTSTPAPPSGWCCPTPRTCTGSTPSGPVPTRSSWARPRCATTIPGCSSAPPTSVPGAAARGGPSRRSR